MGDRKANKGQTRQPQLPFASISIAMRESNYKPHLLRPYVPSCTHKDDPSIAIPLRRSFNYYAAVFTMYNVLCAEQLPVAVATY